MNNNEIAQQVLIREVGKILNETDVQPTDNFIEIGGNSFLAIHVAINLKEKERLEISISQLLGDRLENVFIKPIDN